MKLLLSDSVYYWLALSQLTSLLFTQKPFHQVEAFGSIDCFNFKGCIYPFELLGLLLCYFTRCGLRNSLHLITVIKASDNISTIPSVDRWNYNKLCDHIGSISYVVTTNQFILFLRVRRTIASKLYLFPAVEVLISNDLRNTKPKIGPRLL